MTVSNSSARVAELRQQRSRAKGKIIRAEESIWRLRDTIRKCETEVRLAEAELAAMGVKVRR